MAKGKSTWKYNKLLTARRNYFLPGGPIVTATDQFNQSITPTALNMGDINNQMSGLSNKLEASGTLGGNTPIGGGAGGAGMMSGIASIGMQAAKDISGMISKIGGAEIKEKANQIASGINQSQIKAPTGTDTFDALASDMASLSQIGHVSAKQLGAKGFGQGFGEAFAAGNQGFAAGASMGPIGAAASAIGSTATSIIGDLFGNRHAKKEARRLNKLIDYTNRFNERSLNNRADNLINAQASGLEATYAAFGGPLGGSAIDYDFMNRYITAKEDAAMGKDSKLTSLPNSFASGGGIHIKPENRGKFTETKRRTGKTTEELTHSSNPLTRKRAIFAQNARKWHHAFGGDLMTHGADFSNGLTFINNGGSHEENPFEGVPMGVDNEGTPNLVEEGETIFNDYVFSKRINVPKAIRDKYKLRGTKDLSFADASKQLAKESEERPNDPISEKGLQALMSDLANAQEGIKAMRQENQFANGGKVNKFDDGGYDWNPFLTALSGYTSSRIAGNTSGKYRPDPFIPMEGNPYMLGAANIAALEEKDAYKVFTNAMLANPNMDYIRALDAGVAEGVPRLIGEDGRLVDNWRDLYRTRRTDTKGGIYHWTPTMAAIQEATAPETTIEANPAVANTSATVAEEAKKRFDRYYYNKGTRENPEWVLLEGQDNAPLWMRNNKYRYDSKNEREDGIDYYYDTDVPLDLGRNKLEPLRYAPAVGYGIGALTDVLELTNRPDYSNADAILEATRGAGTYQPVEFNPIGNYLTYRPFDRDFYTNKLSAEAGATRRAVLQNAGMNRGAGMSAILAADYNAQNQLGQLFRQAEEYNLAQRQQVEEFNRATNMANSEGFLKADLANQEALLKNREFNLKGTLTAAEMRESARLAAAKNKAANMSGLFQSLGDIGYEAKNDNMARRLIESGFAPGAEKVYMGAKGGKLKRKRKRTDICLGLE